MDVWNEEGTNGLTLMDSRTARRDQEGEIS
jgi:hypothetical protein